MIISKGDYTINNYELMVSRKKVADKTMKNISDTILHSSTYPEHTSNGFKLLSNIGEELSVPLQSAESLSK